jgi:hypothetical protein
VRFFPQRCVENSAHARGLRPHARLPI